MTASARRRIVGEPVDRIDGTMKVTGAAQYSSDFSFPDLTHAVLVGSTIASGTISRINTAHAQAASGVLAVITHENAPALTEAPATPLGPAPPFPLRDNRVLHYGQHVAVVVARTREDARAAAGAIEIDYEEAEPVLGIDDPGAPVLLDGWGQDVHWGDVSAALACAEVVYDETFTTVPVVPNPMGLFATVARWDGDRLTVHDASQDPMLARTTLATVFDLREADVRVLVPYLGGGFGSGLRVWPHVILTALAARILGRPVKLVLTRPQMFTSVGHRPQTLQRVRLGATASNL
jgi:xanthine dehydrogenase YagR molybdenum-binding subunit